MMLSLNHRAPLIFFLLVYNRILLLFSQFLLPIFSSVMNGMHAALRDPNYIYSARIIFVETTVSIALLMILP
jgi:hypothetical protein